MADIPPCPNFKRGTCERSDPIILAEKEEHIEVGCLTCRCGYVVVLPEGKQHARFENRLAEIKRRHQLERDAERKKVFYAPRTGWIS